MKKETKFTPGPWEMSRCYNGSTTICIMRTYEDVCNVQAKEGSLPRGFEATEANARLIAAAPELYEALKQIIADLPTKRDWLDPVLEKMAKAALSKAQPDSE